MSLQHLKNFYHFLIALTANIFYGFPSKKIFVIGVTGTNGKTTTVKMISNILEKAGHKLGAISTIDFQIGKKRWVNKTKFTTLSSFAHQKFLAQCVKEKCQFAVIEISSHSLDQNRAWGTDYDIGVITNITREHLDYHRTIEKYRLAKLKMFKYLAKKNTAFKNKRESGFAVINYSLKNPQEFVLNDPSKIYFYAIKSFDSGENNILNKSSNFFQAENILIERKGTSFTLNKSNYQIGLTGIFNVENALAAICVGKILGIKEQIIKEALANLRKIPGRLEEVSNDKEVKIIIDYALTPDSMEKVGKLLRNKLDETKGEKPLFYWIFGSCGERDRGKRPIMGKIAAKYADKIIITNEDPYHEDPQQIIDEVFKGVLEGGKTEGKNAFRIKNRREAIKKALSLAKRGDLLLITGKGAEENMKVGNKLIKWNDKRVVKKLLEGI
jgi:UDP-N-acetylmuramoyl-L-alanyl-D-glutamate--2,6-diaminopimelate ligase